MNSDETYPQRVEESGEGEVYQPPSVEEVIAGVELPEGEGEGVIRLMKVMKRLRDPDGCPWDRSQTHQTLLGNLLEETYELFQAISSGDREAMREELGDLFLQVVFHAQIAREEGWFSLGAVCRELTEKLIRRHPHVFGPHHAGTPEEALSTWHRAKVKESPIASSLGAVPRAMPALLRARKIQEKASRLGFDWANYEGAWEKFLEEVKELSKAIEESHQERIAEELGDALFALVNVARFFHICPEVALIQTIEKFLKRFQQVEDRLRAKGISWNEASLSQMDAEWDEVKRSERM
ncbi:MAG: nucleoside triphosphate pyrophosphohydrolase [bacterium]